MSSVPAKRPASYEDLQNLSENVVGEIIDGELVASPRPALRQAAASALGADLTPTFGRRSGSGPGGSIILAEPEIHVVGQLLVPDRAAWRLVDSVAGSVKVRAEPFEALEIDLANLWAR